MAKLALDPVKVACFNAFWATRHQEEGPVVFSPEDLAELLLAMANSEANKGVPAEWQDGPSAWERPAP